MVEVISVVTDSLMKLSQHSSSLIPLLLAIAVIIGFAVIGVVVWKGR